MSITKQLNIDSWSVSYVLEWIKGLSSYSTMYIPEFEARNITGKKLSLLERSDIDEILISSDDANLTHRFAIYKSIQNLLQMSHDLKNESLHTMIFLTQSRIGQVLNCVYRLRDCECYLRKSVEGKCICMK